MRTAPLVLVLGACSSYPPLPVVDDPCAAWQEPGLYRHELVAPDGRDRFAYVWVPDSAGPRDLAVVLHGGQMSARDMSEVTQHIPLANERGFVAVFPQGRLTWLWRGWNAGDCCGNLDDDHRGIDDLGFLEQLVDEVSPLVCGGEVLATGFSNGGMMAHRWACEGAAVDGLVPAAGPLVSDPARCEGPALPVRHYHGAEDPTVPLDGGSGERGLTTYPSAEESLAVWRERNGCSDEPPVTFTEGEATCTAWTCEAPTELCVVEGWGHRWPGGTHASELELDATTDGWDFFTSAIR